MSNAHKKTIINVLVLYLSSTILLVTILAYGYYHFQKESYEKQEQYELKELAKNIYTKIQDLHNIAIRTNYPRFDNYQSAIYDIDKNQLFSTMKNNDIALENTYFQKNGYSYFVYEMTPYYLGSAYIVVEKKSESILLHLSQKIFLFTFFVVLILIATSWFIVKMLIKPLKDNALFLDRFIRDTTHELNTPITTILNNIEMLESLDIANEKAKKKIDRIKMASVNISNLYEDLSYLILKHKVASQNELINFNTLIQQRIEYFDLLTKAKNIEITLIENTQLNFTIDKKKATRITDNLLSNAIKYTKENSAIIIKIDPKTISFEDEGEGMTQEQINKVFERYTRFNSVQGGFGLGFNIIYTICNEYNITIAIDSKINEGTCVTLNF